MSPAQTSKALPYSRVYPADVIDSAWDVPQAEVLAAARRRVGSLSGVLQEALAAFAILGIVFMLQAAAGAYRGERASYSDEASHFMNALLVRDYVRDGIGQHPLRFAEQYYISYPKIAPGMWPPLFHAVLGVLMLANRSPQTTALALLALISTWTSWRLYRMVSLFETRFVGLLIAVAFVLTTAIIDLTTAIMLDLAVAALALEATYWFAIFLTTGKKRHAGLFGIAAALCCLTKGNGLSLILMPAALVMFTRRFDVLRHAGLYLAAAIVLGFAMPPLFVSYRLDAAIGDFGAVGLADVVARLYFYSAFLVRQFGAPLLIASLVGVGVGLCPVRDGRVELAWAMKAGLAALIVSSLVFHLFNPHLGIAPRYIALTVAPLLGLLPVGVEQIARGIRQYELRRTLQVAILLTLFAAFLVVRPAMATRYPVGAATTIDFFSKGGLLAGSTILVVTNEEGEGALVSEVASRHPEPVATVLRGSKVVATDDWAGRRFKMLFASPGDLLQELEDLHVDYLVMDYSKPAMGVAFWSQVNAMIETYSPRFERMYEVDAGHRLVIYRLKYRTPGSPKRLEVPLTYSLGRVIGR